MRTKAKPKRWASKTRRSGIVFSRRKVSGLRLVKRKAPTLVSQNKKARKEIGVARVPQAASKTRVVTELGLTASTRTLYSYALTNIPFGLNINQRQKNECKIKGFKLRICGRQLTQTDPKIVRMAIVAPKVSPTPSGINFFKGYGTDKSLDFSNARSGLEFTTFAINDREYAVIWYKSIKMAANLMNDVASIYDNHNTQFYVNKYIRLNRTLLWDSEADAEPASDRMFLLVWLDNPLNAATAVPVANSAAIQMHVTTYYRDGN